MRETRSSNPMTDLHDIIARQNSGNAYFLIVVAAIIGTAVLFGYMETPDVGWCECVR